MIPTIFIIVACILLYITIIGIMYVGMAVEVNNYSSQTTNNANIKEILYKKRRKKALLFVVCLHIILQLVNNLPFILKWL